MWRNMQPAVMVYDVISTMMSFAAMNPSKSGQTRGRDTERPLTTVACTLWRNNSGEPVRL